MKRHKILFIIPLLTALLLIAGPPPNAWGVAYVQCPEDTTGDGIADADKVKAPNGDIVDAPGPLGSIDIQCKHLTGGDGWITMADGREIYIFSFADVSDEDAADVLDVGVFRANSPAPTIVTKEGEELYLTMTNVGLFNRPDLFDPHSLHYHGFPNASAIFDGLPESTISINQQASITYYYNNVEPGTYMYHCHVEATEHMQMGMLGNLYVRAAQNGTSYEYPGGSGRTYTQFVYNDADGSTGYDVEYPLQLGSFDPEFHDASWLVQPLPFAMMWDTYPMINGRGYPDTIEPGSLPAPEENGGIASQVESSLVTATAGEKVLLRLSNLNITAVHTLSSPGIPMQVVGIDAKQLKAADGSHLYYTTNSVTLGGGQSYDVILHTTEAMSGHTYFLYSTQLNELANDAENFGGAMTEIHIN
jgi:FtsP/CotA-like multicopper oxidase with cupredoxin domain